MNSRHQPGRRQLLVKICGITRERDAVAAIACGADALGFNIYPGSKRYMDIRQARSWIAKLPAQVMRVVVSVNADADELLRIAEGGYADAFQLHGDEPPECVAKLMRNGLKVIKALPVNSSLISRVQKYETSDILLDAHCPGKFGGSGRLADWKMAGECVAAFPEKRILLSGGLNAENVEAAIRQVAPAGVDVASGVEESPGIKCHAAVAAFVSNARETGI